MKNPHVYVQHDAQPKVVVDDFNVNDVAALFVGSISVRAFGIINDEVSRRDGACKR